MTSTISHKRTLELTYTGIFVALLAVCSWISIPTSIPFTLQTFAVSITILLLGGRRGTVAILVYILLAAAGVPVLACFHGGSGALLGPTGGYILGFLLTGICYWAVTGLAGHSFWARLTGLTLGIILMYVFGTIWFVKVYTANGGTIGYSAAFMVCVAPFLVPEAAKQFLAFTLASRLRRFIPLEN